ncbi:MAG: N-acetylglucosaminyl-diphospho-decaprenol L-rhamnosyltransferase [Solirubrobacteraceae bacterium]|nr:N-acetylglucosaminyl-diphospho-decaprenol L-rhamnosyltransferase [Solirubrobacteraceae bacterium]
MSDATLLVVLHDSEPELQVLLRSVERDLPRRPELVVVDSGSSDGGAALAERHGARVVRLPDNPGFGAANVAGLAEVRTPVTVLLNPDVELLDDGLLRLIEDAVERDALHVPRLLNADGSVQRSAHPLPGTAAALLPALVPPRLLPRRARLAADPWRSPTPRRVGWAIAAVVAARTDTLQRLGPFDPGAFLFFEDLEMCLRGAQAGVPTVLHPEIALRHAGGHSTRAAYAGEPHDLLARRRREVVGARLGRRALALDDAAQALTFATRAVAHLGRGRERAQLRALVRARRSAVTLT